MVTEPEGRQVLELDLHNVGGARARLEGCPELLVVRGALTHVDNLDIDGRVLGLEQVHLALDVGHPGPEGEVGLGGHRCVDVLLEDLIRFGGVRAALILVVSAAGQDERAGGGCHRVRATAAW